MTEQYNERLREYVSSGAFRLDLSVRMIDMLLWTATMVETFPDGTEFGYSMATPQPPTSHDHTTRGSLRRRGLMDHRPPVCDCGRVTDPKFAHEDGCEMRKNRGGWWHHPLTPAGWTVVELLRLAGYRTGWVPISLSLVPSFVDAHGKEIAGLAPQLREWLDDDAKPVST